MRRSDLTAFCLLCAVALSASDTADGIFAPGFKSLQVRVEGNPLAPPVINMYTPDRIIVEFDEMAEEPRYLRYRLLHCNSDWRPSQLVETEYLDGFNQADIDNYALSESTLAHYVHYSLAVPDEDMRPTVSGNYLVQVFDEDNPDEVLLQTRFMLNENTASMTSSVTSRTDTDYNNRHQQISLDAGLDGTDVSDPFNDLRLVVVQNGRPDTRRVIDKPLRIGNRSAVYEHLASLIFPAGNEYRRFEMVNVHYPGLGIDHYDFAEPYYHAIIDTDKIRANDRYEYDEDQSGRYFIREFNSNYPAVDADYIITHFTLESPEMPGMEVYLDGDFVQRRRDADSRMVYDRNRGAYVKTMLLKQGLYNYQYLTYPAGESATAAIEGDKYETVNEYLMLLYHRPPMSRHDRLIGAAVIYSGK